MGAGDYAFFNFSSNVSFKERDIFFSSRRRGMAVILRQIEEEIESFCLIKSFPGLGLKWQNWGNTQTISVTFITTRNFVFCQELELELWTRSQGNMDSQCCIWDLYVRGKIVLAKRPPADLPAKCQLDIWKTLKQQWQGCTWEIQNNLESKKKPALKDSLTFCGKPQKV